MAITKSDQSQPSPSWLKRWLWLLAIWAASVAVMGLLAWLMRGLMQLLGLGH